MILIIFEELNITFFCDWKGHSENQSEPRCSLLSSYYTFINSITEFFENLLLTLSNPPPESKSSLWHYLLNQKDFCIYGGVELAASENGIQSQFIAREEDRQLKTAL